MDYRISEIIEIIEDEFPRKNDLKDLAFLVNLSVSHLQHLFKREVGISIKQFTCNVRLKKTCELLESTNLRIKEICYIIGCHDRSHFVRDFKRKIGLSPSNYRTKIRLDSRKSHKTQYFAINSKSP